MKQTANITLTTVKEAVAKALRVSEDQLTQHSIPQQTSDTYDEVSSNELRMELEDAFDLSLPTNLDLGDKTIAEIYLLLVESRHLQTKKAEADRETSLKAY